jgi:hypothetical protein
MKIGGAFNEAVLGIQRGLRGAQENAAKIASADQFSGAEPTELVEPLVNLKANELQVQASAKVIKAVDEMIGSLLDEKA